MGKIVITSNSKNLELMKSYKNPSYGSKTILSDSVWGYVELWLRRCKNNHSELALFYWQQAKSFYDASISLPYSARPLTAYYCCLNMTKCLLVINDVDNKKLSSHGVSSTKKDKNSNSLFNEEITFQGKGDLNELSRYLEEDVNKVKYPLSNLLYNIPCIHRAYTSTYKSKPELFIPAQDLRFVRIEKTMDAYLQFKIEGRYANKKALKNLPTNYEKDDEFVNEYIIRRKNRFKWDIHINEESRKKELKSYHTKLRKDFFYIYGPMKLWYIKKSIPNNNSIINRSSLTLIFAVMHYISELVRYSPAEFNRLLNTKQNWLVVEFLNMALDQFVDEISAELTHENIYPTKYR
jgi:hypothetical protein